MSDLTGISIIGIESLFMDLDKNISNGKQKILDLSLEIISQSFTIVIFNWHNDILSILKEKIEKFFNKQKTILTIYTAMSSYLPQNLSIDLSEIIIKNLMENYKKILGETNRIESKPNAKH